VRIGGTRHTPRAIQVASPFEDKLLHTFEDASLAAATSGIGRRSWRDESGRPAHHLLDPSTGRPAFTGVVQATALAPTAALATIAALLVHGLSLLGDHYVHVSLAEISIPFLSHYKTGWTAVGIVSAWALILLGPSYYVRRAIGQERWRKLHRFTALAWIGGLVHSLGEGTDAGSIWFLTMAALSTLPAFVMLILRNFQASTAQ